MADSFNKEPISFVDQNEQFPVLDDKIGLTYQQFKTLVENTNYLYNNLGLSSIEINSVKTEFPSPGSFSDVIVEHNIDYVNGKPIDLLDFGFKIPTPRISASLKTDIVDENTPTGMTLVTAPIIEQINNTNVTTGYEFEFYAKLPKTPEYYIQYIEQNLTDEQKAQARKNIGAGTSSFSGMYNDLFGKPNFSNVATSGDYNDLINTPVLSKVAISGLYNDLINKPTAVLYGLSQNLSLSQQEQARRNIGAGTSSFSGVYNDLIDKPTKLSQFDNDVGYLTNATLNFVSYEEQNLSNIQKQQARKNIGAGTSDFNGDYNNLSNKPAIPNTTSDLTNDSGFITKDVDNLTNYYDKTYIDNLDFGDGADLSNYYTKQETYSKTEIDDIVKNIDIDLSNYYTIAQTNSAIEQSIDKLSTVAKTGNYSDLNGIPTIPTKVSDLTNDSGFITNAVNNLLNYYTKTEINNMFTSGNISFEFVTELPETGEQNIIYFVSNNSDIDNNLFNEYVWTINNTWEELGSVSIDLSNYYNKQETTLLIEQNINNLSTVAKTGNYDDLIGTPNIPTNTSDLVNNSGFITVDVDNLTFYYNKTTIDEKINSIPSFDSSQYYNKTETNNLIANAEYVSYSISQPLTDIQKERARLNIGATNFNGDYNSLTNLPVIDTIIKDSTNAVQNSAIYNKFVTVDENISQIEDISNNAYSTAQNASSTANNINSKLNSLTLVDNGDNTYTLKFTQDNVSVGTITIPDDQYIETVNQNLIQNNIIFTWKQRSVNYPTGQYSVDLSPYVYTAGAGISTAKISDTDNRNVLSILLDTTDKNNKLFFNSSTGGLNVNLSSYATIEHAENYAKTYADTLVNNLIDGAPETLDTLKEIADWIANDETGTVALTNRVANNETNISTLNTNVSNINNEIDTINNTILELNSSIPNITLNGSVTKSPSFYAPTTAGTKDFFLKSNGFGEPIWAEIPDNSIAIDTELSTTSTNPVQNRIITNNIYYIFENKASGIVIEKPYSLPGAPIPAPIFIPVENSYLKMEDFANGQPNYCDRIIDFKTNDPSTSYIKFASGLLIAWGQWTVGRDVTNYLHTYGFNGFTFANTNYTLTFQLGVKGYNDFMNGVGFNSKSTTGFYYSTRYDQTELNWFAIGKWAEV